MKKRSIFYAILLLGTGAFIFLQDRAPEGLGFIIDWRILFIIIGAAFLADSGRGRKQESFLPGMLFLLFGLHFLLAETVASWPGHEGMYALILGISILFHFVKTKSDGVIPGFLLLFTGAAFFFSDELRGLIGDTFLAPVIQYAPFILIISGVYLLFFKK
ncbi:hypothetical protein [Alteribacillus sp. HJP-4]|uniref:hypothetical protein n=1 Tax=Alteribacillus sp. HJP-4 TaxID=2775394 RepID=UPI0035CD3B41